MIKDGENIKAAEEQELIQYKAKSKVSDVHTLYSKEQLEAMSTSKKNEMHL